MKVILHLLGWQDIFIITVGFKMNQTPWWF